MVVCLVGLCRGGLKSAHVEVSTCSGPGEAPVKREARIENRRIYK